MYSLNEFKKRLDNIYNNLENIEKFGVDTKKLKDQIENFDKYCDKFDTNSNTAVEVQYARKDIKELNVLDSGIKLLEQNIININYALGLIKTIEELEISKDTTKEELNEIVLKVMDQLHMFYRYKDILNNELLDSIYPEIYQIIKYEFKYNGKSTILDFLEPNKLLTNRFFELWSDDYNLHKDLFVKDKLKFDYPVSSYYLNTVLFRIAINEDNYLDSVEDKLDESIEDFNIKSTDKREITYLLTQQLQRNKERRKAFRKVNSKVIPFFVSLGILIGANVVGTNVSTENSPYKTTKTTYSTVNEEVQTEESYSKSNVGDVTITIYYPTDEKKARIIKQYELNDENFNVEDYENIDFDSLDFVSSKYQVDEDSNKVSTDKYVVVEKVTNIDENDKKPVIWARVLFGVLATGLTFMGDIAIACATEHSKFFLSDITDLPYAIDKLKTEAKLANKYHPKKNTKETKETIKQLKKQILESKKEYEELFNSYSYLESYLNEDGYQRKLN